MRAIEQEIAGFQRLVDLFDRHAGDDEAVAAQVREGRAVGRKQWREGALIRLRHRVADAGRAGEIGEPQWVMSEQVIEALGERHVRPVIGDADQFHPVAAIGRRRLGELRLDERDGRIVGLADAALRRATAAGRSIRSARCSRRDRQS